MNSSFLNGVKISPWILCFSLLCFCAYAQQTTAPELKFEHVSSSKGFYSNSINSNIVQDKTGFIWFGTDDGLYRFDGIDFRPFSDDPWDKKSFTGNGVNSLYASDDNTLWIGAFAGLWVYDPVSETFSVFKSKEKKFEFLSTETINSMAADHQHNLWVCATGKIVTINLSTYEVKFVMELQGLAYPFIDRNGNAWIATDGKGLYYIDHLTKKTTIYRHDPKDKNSISVDNVFSVTEDNNGHIWCATTEGVCQFDTATQKFTIYKHKNDQPASLGSNFVNGGVYVDREGTVWAGTWSEGINRFVPETGTFIHYKRNRNDPNAIGSNNITEMFVDNSGMLWVGTTDKGLFKCYLEKENYSLYQNFTENPSRDNGAVYSVYCDTKGIIWLAMKEDGIYSFDPSSKKFRPWINGPDNKTLRHCMTPATNFYDDGKDLWVTAVYEGLMKLNRETGKGTLIHSNFLIPEKIKDYTNYFYIDADSSGRLWMGGQRGITIYDPVTRQLKSFKQIYKDTNQLSSDPDLNVEFIDGYIWALGSESGLTRINPYDGTVKVYHHTDGDPSSLASNNLMQMAEDKNNFLWIATWGKGIIVFDRKKELFRTYTVNDSLSSNNIDGIICDNCNNIWFITHKGISRCSYDNRASPFSGKLTVKNFDFGENSGGNADGASWCTKGKDGTFYFATQKGLLRFHPDSLKNNPFIPPVVLTDLLLFNKKISANDSSGFLKSSITFAKSIRLSYKENVIGFKFAALSYNHPEKNLYAYKLHGFDKDWIYTDASKPFANYTNLDAGEYTFKVKASNNDGVWNEEGTSIILIITPPFWQTWWFYTLCALVTASIVYAFYRYRLQQVIKLQMIRNNIASDLHDDIGSTLNSISIFSEVAKQQSKEDLPALEEIGVSSRKIIDSMSDIVWTINPENDSFEKIILRMRSFAYQLLRAKEIEMVFKADEALNSVLLPMLFRKNFYLIFKEATNNMVKYSGASRASFHISYSKKQINLEIRDNGKGFNLKEVKDGNGIKNMRRRANEIKAELNIVSKVNEGTNIELTLII
jgi:ligand-binding sensor domain-containing protein/two-component sensor histidine kinase